MLNLALPSFVISSFIWSFIFQVNRLKLIFDSQDYIYELVCLVSNHPPSLYYPAFTVKSLIPKIYLENLSPTPPATAYDSAWVT